MKQSRKKKILLDQQGVTLIVVLWVTVLLTVMVNGFIVMVRTEAQGLSNFKAQTEAYYLARSGINIALSKLQKFHKDQDAPALLEEREEEMIDRWYWDGRVRNIPLWNGHVEIRVMDEGGKIDVNQSTRDDLVRVLLALSIKGNERDEIVASILDWRDENNFHRLNGAEDDYYRSLPEPYESKDGPLDTIDELLWVKGVTPEMFFGQNDLDPLDVEGAGLMNAFTVFSKSVKVNINTAPLAVLLSLPGMDEETAFAIIDAREDKALQSMGDFTRAGGRLAPTISKYVTFSSPKIYHIEATGVLEGRRVKYAIQAVVKISKKDPVRILYWKDQSTFRRGTS